MNAFARVLSHNELWSLWSLEHKWSDRGKIGEMETGLTGPHALSGWALIEHMRNTS